MAMSSNTIKSWFDMYPEDFVTTLPAADDVRHPDWHNRDLLAMSISAYEGFDSGHDES